MEASAAAGSGLVAAVFEMQLCSGVESRRVERWQ